MRLLRYLSLIGLKEFFERLETFQILEELFHQTTLVAKCETTVVTVNRVNSPYFFKNNQVEIEAF